MPVVPSPPTFEVGMSDTTELNLLRDCILFLQGPPAAQLRQTSVQSLANATFTAITFTTEDLDSHNGHDNVTNPSRYVAVYAGWYLLSGVVSFASNATGVRGTTWIVNGAVVNGSGANQVSVTANVADVAAEAMLVYLNVGDYVELGGFQSSGAPLNTFATAGNSPAMTVLWERNA